MKVKETELNSEIENIENQIELLQSEKEVYVEKANNAYLNKDYKTEDLNQKEIDLRVNQIEELKTKIIEIKYKDFDVDLEINKKKKQHDWKGGSERCNKCSMKRTTTFSWKANGVHVNWKAGFKATALDILESMECKRH